MEHTGALYPSAGAVETSHCGFTSRAGTARVVRWGLNEAEATAGVYAGFMVLTSSSDTSDAVWRPFFLVLC